MCGVEREGRVGALCPRTGMKKPEKSDWHDPGVSEVNSEEVSGKKKWGLTDIRESDDDVWRRHITI